MGSNTTELPLAIVSTDTSALREVSWAVSTFGYQPVASSDWSEQAPWRQLQAPALLILDARDEQQCEAALQSPRSAPYAYRVALYDADLMASPDMLMDLGADDLVRLPVDAGELMTCLRRGARRLEFERRFRVSTTFDLQRGVANRRGFVRQLERKLQDKGDATDSALVVLTIDFLETIRVQYGFVAVERASALAAEVLHDSLSGDDYRGLIDEGIYAALLPGRSVGDGVLFAQEIARTVKERSTTICGDGPQVSLSGVVLAWPSGDAAEVTVDRALAALRHVRGWGGNQVLDANDVEREYAAWQQRLSSGQLTDARHVMEALPLVVPSSTAMHANALGIYSFASGRVPPCVPVVDDVGHLVGVIEAEALRTHGSNVFSALDDHLEPVAATLRSDACLDDIATSLATADRDYLLVVDNKKPIGYVTNETIVALREQTGGEADDHQFAQADCGLDALVVPLI